MNAPVAKKIWIALILMAVLAGPLSAQWFSAAALDARQHHLAVSAAGEYRELTAQYGRLDLRTFFPEVQAFVSPWSWLIFSVGIGYGNLWITLPPVPELKFEPGYQFNGSVTVGPVPIAGPLFSVAFSGWGEVLNAYGHQDRDVRIGASSWVDKKEYLYTGYFAAAGIVLVSELGRFVFFAGPHAVQDRQRVKSRRILQSGEQTFGLSETSWDANSGVVPGFFAGVAVRLPGRFSIGMSVRANKNDQLGVSFSLAQAGSP